MAVTKAAAARAAANVRRRAGKELAAKGGNGARPEWSKDNGARPRKGYVFYSISILEFPLCMVAKTSRFVGIFAALQWKHGGCKLH